MEILKGRYIELFCNIEVCELLDKKILGEINSSLQNRREENDQPIQFSKAFQKLILQLELEKKFFNLIGFYFFLIIKSNFEADARPQGQSKAASTRIKKTETIWYSSGESF